MNIQISAVDNSLWVWHQVCLEVPCHLQLTKQNTQISAADKSLWVCYQLTLSQKDFCKP